MPDDSYTLCKEEHLCGKRAITELFASGKSYFQAPYKLVWIVVAEPYPYPSRFAVAVPKRLFKHAVDRNLLKRRTREAFRLNKQLLAAAVKEGQHIRLMLIYTSGKLLPYGDLDAAMKKILQHIARQNAPSD
ncbi:MAG: ribonuclease P protein component [Bacteroidales bacterium]|jgi:ribonuclease P protein component|nr:ribonuclease P protein component [Bacteroidales bacterium]